MTNEPVTEYPVIIVTTLTYRVWVQDWDEEGPDEIIKRLQEGGYAHELLEGKTTIDGYLEVRAPEWHEESHEPDRLGPLPQCRDSLCERLVYYGVWCYEHNPDRPGRSVQDVVKTL